MSRYNAGSDNSNNWAGMWISSSGKLHTRTGGTSGTTECDTQQGVLSCG